MNKDGGRYYRLLIETMHDALCILSSDARITYVNPQFSNLTGYPSSELLMTLLGDWLDEDNRAIFYEQLQQIEQGSRSYELAFIHPDGRTVYLLVSSTPLFDVAGRFDGSFSVIKDISERVAMERALREGNAELDAFAHTVAHDLKNPIAVLMGFTSMLETDFDKMSEKEMREYLHTITRTADKMINIIDELLLLSEMRHIEVNKRPLDNITLVLEALKRLEYMIEQYGAMVDMPDFDLWPTALGHGPWVEEIWVNYISNAIKYGGQPPRILLGAQREDDMVRYWVSDNGHGISAEKLGRLFIPFTRLDTVRAEGHGLGLSIVQRIVAKLGGEVGIHSEIGQGSVFSFTLPVDDSPED